MHLEVQAAASPAPEGQAAQGSPREVMGFDKDKGESAAAQEEETRTKVQGQVHPVAHHRDVLDCIKLVRVDDFLKLSAPMPRCQDLPDEYFGVPDADGLLVSVSHGWRNQTHPDPTGSKLCKVSAIFKEMQQEVQATLYTFFDFLSIDQLPFRPVQQPRTPEQQSRFKGALECMHNMYMLADRIIHLEFESESVEGEGEVYCLSAGSLRGVAVAKVGDWIQILKTPTVWEHVVHLDGHESFEASSEAWDTSLQTTLFHRILAIDGASVSSVDQLDRVGEDDDNRIVTLVRYPFGRANEIPADERGWIFLERFITAVKCAMLDESEAAKVVVTHSEHIRAQIKSYADRLRTAACKKNPSYLERVLNEALAELGTKRFSASSTDKILIDSGKEVNPDRVVVGDIMRTFTLGLSSTWHEEAKRQQTRAHKVTRRVYEAAADYLLHWEEFSPDQIQKLKMASTMNPWPLLCIVFLSPLPALSFFLPIYAKPSEGLHAQLGFIFICWPEISMICYMFPAFLLGTTHLPCTRTIELKMVAWSVACGIIIVCIVMAGIAGSLDIWPVPAVPLIGCGVVIGALLALWLLVPPHLRSTRDMKVRILASMGILISILAIFGGLFPLLNALLASTEKVYLQALIVLCFLAFKLMFDKLGLKAAKTVGADAMPNVIFFSTFAYEVNLCIALGSGFDWMVFVELLAIDFVENLYSLWCLWRSSAEEADEGKNYLIASTLVLREFVELVTSCGFLMHIFFAWYAQTEFIELFCKLTDAEFWRMVLFVIVDIVVEVTMSTMTYCIMRKQGHEPFTLLRGLASEYKRVFIISSAGLWLYYWCLQHTHNGLDLTLRFRWLTEPGSHWECGLTWSST